MTTDPNPAGQETPNGPESSTDGKSEAHRQDAETRYRSFFNEALNALLLIDVEGKIIEVNRAAKEMFDCSQEDLMGMHLSDLFMHPTDFYNFQRQLEATGSVREIGAQLRTLDGRIIESQLSSSTISVDEGNVLGYSVSVQETMHIRKMEEALWESLQTSTDIVQAIPSGLLIFSYLPPEMLIFEDGNPAAEELLRMEIEETCGMELNDIWPQARETGLTEKILDVIETGESFRTDDFHYMDKRVERFFSIHAFRMPGRRLGMTFEDITERKKAEMALKRRLEFEKVAATISSRLVGLLDLDASINDSLADMGELSGANRVYLLYLREDMKDMYNAYEWCDEGVEPWAMELYSTPFASHTWWLSKLQKGETINITSVPELPGEAWAEKDILESHGIGSHLMLPLSIEGKLAGFLGFDNIVGTEIWSSEDFAILRTSSEAIGNAIERKMADDRIREETKKRSHVVVNTSHLLHTPLTVIRGYMEMIQMGKRELTTDLLEKMMRKLNEMKRLVDGQLYDNIELMTVETSDGFTPAKEIRDVRGAARNRE